MDYWAESIKTKHLLWIALGLITLYFLPYFYLGEDAHILIHDNLDSNFVWAKLVIENGGMFSNPDTLIPQILGGVPRSSVFGTYDLSLVWFSIFGMYWGYVINKIIMSLVAFWGMYLLLGKFIQNEGFSRFVRVGVALMYALLPFWSFTLSVAGLPMVLYAFLNIRSGLSYKWDWLIIVVIPWYSSLVLSGFFMLVILGLIWLYDIAKTKKINYWFFSGLVLYGIMFVFSHLPLFYSFVVQTGELSHRVEMVWPTVDLMGSWHFMKSIFAEGQYHAHSLHSNLVYLIIGSVIMSLVTKNNSKVAISGLIFIALTSILYGALKFVGLSDQVQWLMNVVPIQLQRFHFIHPMVWYILLAIGLVNLVEKWKWAKYVALTVIIFQIGFIASKHEVINQDSAPTFKQFFAAEQFDVLKSKMETPIVSNKVISVGIHPSISQYNGLYSLDGYLPSYPLKYKHQFREIIAGELQKSEPLKLYFDNWGSRCYAFSNELGKDFVSNDRDSIQDLKYDFEAFKNIGGTYLISSSEILNNNRLELVEVSTGDSYYWSLFLYKVL